MAGALGIEPRLSVLETDVLAVEHYPPLQAAEKGRQLRSHRQQNPQRTPEGTLPVFSLLRPCCRSFLSNLLAASRRPFPDSPSPRDFISLLYETYASGKIGNTYCAQFGRDRFFCFSLS